MSSGFASGDRVVVGHWDRTPIGPIADVMWATPAGVRILLVPSDEAGDFVSGVYGFDEVRVVPFAVALAERVLTVEAGPISLRFDAGRRIPIPGPRPAWLTRYVEAPIARLVMGVETYGVSPTGVEEWYRARSYAGLRAATAVLDGRSLGAMAPVDPPAGFGFSEPPARPSWVEVTPRLRYPDGVRPVR